jgi:hypothetical protein
MDSAATPSDGNRIEDSMKFLASLKLRMPPTFDSISTASEGNDEMLGSAATASNGNAGRQNMITSGFIEFCTTNTTWG